MIFWRTLTLPMLRAAQTGEPLLIEGPRGAGKTTLARREFPRRPYVSLEEDQVRRAARSDPAAFVARFRSPAIIDDAHRAPELLPYIKDSAHLYLSSRKLAASTVTTVRLYPPTAAERQSRPPLPLDMLGRFAPAVNSSKPAPFAAPERRKLPVLDVIDLIGVRDLDRFDQFHRIAFEASGTLLDRENLAREAGVSRTTAIRWLAVLDACLQTVELAPFENAFGRRQVRSSKLHFLDSPNWESLVVSEIYRNATHTTGQPPDLRYWRDSNGLEVPLIVQQPGFPPVAVAIAEAPNPTIEARLRRWMDLAGTRHGALISPSPRSSAGPILRYSLADL